MVRNTEVLVLSIFTSILVAFSAGSAFAWTGATTTPPNGGVSAPINVSSKDQTKSGGLLNVWNLWVNSALGVTGGGYFGGNVGIGTVAPNAQLQVVGSTNKEFSLYDYGGGHGVIARMYAANGSVAAPTAVKLGDILGGFAARGYNGSTFARGARIMALPSENWTPIANGGVLVFETAPSSPNPPNCIGSDISGAGGACSIERMRIDQNGKVGIGTASPTAPLDVVSPGPNEGGGHSNAAFFRTDFQNAGWQNHNVISLDNVNGNGSFRNEVDFRGNGNVKWYLANDKDYNGSDNFFIARWVGFDYYGLFIDSNGRIGIGNNTNPVATLDVNGFARLAPQTSAPAICNASLRGSMAFSSGSGRICVCDGSWKFDNDGSACAW